LWANGRSERTCTPSLRSVRRVLRRADRYKAGDSISPNDETRQCQVMLSLGSLIIWSSAHLVARIDALEQPSTRADVAPRGEGTPVRRTTRCYVDSPSGSSSGTPINAPISRSELIGSYNFCSRPMARARRTELRAPPERALCPPRTADMSELAVSAPRGC
jgi:hypothetical protein